MPKFVNSLPKFRKHRANGQAIVTIRGRDHYLGPVGFKASRLEYDRLIAEWATVGRRNAPGSSSISSDLTVAELLVTCLQHAKAYYRGADGHPTSEVSAYIAAIRPWKELYGRTPIRDFGPLALKAGRQKMIDSGWVRTSINKQVGRIRRVIKWGVENELVDASVLQRLQAVAALRYGRTQAAESDPVKPVPDAYVDAVLRHVSPTIGAMIELQRLTGMRSGEVVIMRC